MKHNKARFWVVLIMLSTVGLTTLVGCAGSLKNADKPGAMLWGENCGRCHNVRSPETLSDSQWEVAVMHMRTRANLSAAEAEKIVEFLKSAN
jgi:hypothetical protein